MDVLGNNIANVNTTSFKSQSITFSDLMYQTTQAASGATETKGGVNARQIGLGAKSGAIGTAIESQGATQTTNNPFDIMITGKSFFVVNNGKENLFTRDGSFYVDGAGNLAMQSNGYFVMGWNATEDPDTGEITVNKNGELSNLQIMSAENATYSPASTTSALVSGNIDDNDPNVVSDDGKTITLEFYDNKGYLYTGKFNIKDTGEDHLFSVELTEIIDSNGVKFTADKMAGISLGNMQESEGYKEIEDGYYITVNNPTKTGEVASATIYQQMGQPVFTDVPSTGDSITTLSNIQNFLSKIYPTASTKRYSNIQSYEIDADYLNVTFEYPDYSSSIGSATEYKSFTKDNTDYWFYDSTTNFGYISPSTSDDTDNNKMNSLSTDMLKNVFKMDTTTDGQNILTNISSYNYSFDQGTKTLTVLPKVDLETEDDQVSAAELKTKYDNYFKQQGGSNKISDIITSIKADTTTYPYGEYYTYDKDSGILEIYGGKADTKDKNVSGSSGTDSKVYTFLSDRMDEDLSVDISGLDKTTSPEYAQLKAIVDNAYPSTLAITGFDDKINYNFNFDSSDPTLSTFDISVEYLGVNYTLGTISNDATNADLYAYLYEKLTTISASDLNTRQLKEIKGQIETTADLDDSSIYFTFDPKDITGTTGFVLDINYKESTVKFDSNPIATFEMNSFDFTADASFEYGVPTSVFKDQSTKKTGYVLFDKGKAGWTLDEIPEAILKEIYGSNVTYDYIRSCNETPTDKYEDYNDDFTKAPNQVDVSDFNVTFENGGKIVVKHQWTDNVPISTDYLCEVKDGKATFTTAKDVVAYPIDTTKGTTFPAEGYISDLLSTADSQTKGLLETAYGITDADARAYGSEGYYVIDEELGIKLYTSKSDASKANKTVQLVFDAATGNIKSANNNETDKKVNLIFDQSVEGLEAFGFQETPGSERTVGSIEIDFSTVTNYNTNGSSTIKVVKGDKSSLNTGRAVGEMNGVTISTDGTIYATYSNGQTKLLGQIASAEFANASGLAKEGDNLYSQTLNSGEATIQDITTDGGYMNTGVLEMSNVDLSREFTEMITTQRGFQANSRIITVSDTLLEELTNLKR
jgi:flagellar hook protein FlgE